MRYASLGSICKIRDGNAIFRARESQVVLGRKPCCIQDAQRSKNQIKSNRRSQVPPISRLYMADTCGETPKYTLEQVISKEEVPYISEIYPDKKQNLPYITQIDGRNGDDA